MSANKKSSFIILERDLMRAYNYISNSICEPKKTKCLLDETVKVSYQLIKSATIDLNDLKDSIL
ncbi:hypothetical protein HZS_4071 [Henneguya salminicola]|nr:hypothetical protein HZS_4071 [Henneguya salminicola]